MAPIELRFRWISDESMDILIGGESVGNWNHDDHGWSGMDDIQKALIKIAEKQGWDIVTEFEADEDD